MKFIRSMVLVALVLLLLGSAGVVGAAEITVNTPTTPVPVGEKVVVPVVVTGAEKLDACDISITTDASDVTIVANTTNPVDGGVLAVHTVDNVAKISFYHLNGVTGDLTLCSVDCVPKKSGTSAPVNLTVESIAENGSAGTPGDAVYAKYAVVNGTITTKRDPGSPSKPGRTSGGSPGGSHGGSSVKTPVSPPTTLAPSSEYLAVNETIIPTQVPGTIAPATPTAAQTAVPTNVTPTRPAPSPGFGVVAALAGAMSAALLLAGRRD
ncbi:PGF-CTERM protein [Methanofollis sp. W23]|uniref:hypothetical protein n=1 Tax=Methanofollis sp. W23 TaxID=2817849 RepID=UPI001AE3D8D8|nr:hypothetical protein [Methanofollis sp. W23]MBP2144749.1 PGF-CTERM protein [Methanofollis sp. W23]